MAVDRLDRFSGAALAGLSVLVVEDEPNIGACLERALSDLGCRVAGPVGSVAEALALLRGERPDLALLDLSLQDGHAGPVAATLGALAVPFAVMTGWSRRHLTAPALQAAPRLAKPFGLADVEGVLRRLAGERPMAPMPGDRPPARPSRWAGSGPSPATA